MTHPSAAWRGMGGKGSDTGQLAGSTWRFDAPRPKSVGGVMFGYRNGRVGSFSSSLRHTSHASYEGEKVFPAAPWLVRHIEYRTSGKGKGKGRQGTLRFSSPCW
ncbi:hypothetical protein D3C80_1058100 [compost metagenome]